MNDWRWYYRLPVKWGLLALTALAVSFPHPGRLLEHVSRWGDPDALIDPDAPPLQPLRQELASLITQGLSGPEVLRKVERFVYEKVPYAWDWDTWGNADYIPTVAQVLEKGREDCDGRAVIAASLLRGLGYKAELVTDFSHVWVKTEVGETMGPGKTKVVVATKEGWEFGAALFKSLAEVPKAFAYGTAVFPFFREVIVVAVLWLLLLGRGQTRTRRVVAAALLINGLILFRLGGVDYRRPLPWIQLAAAVDFAAGVAVLYLGFKNQEKTTSVDDQSGRADPSATSTV